MHATVFKLKLGFAIFPLIVPHSLIHSSIIYSTYKIPLKLLPKLKETRNKKL